MRHFFHDYPHQASIRTHEDRLLYLSAETQEVRPAIANLRESRQKQVTMHLASTPGSQCRFTHQ